MGEDPANAQGYEELAVLFCTQARRRVDTLFHELWANDDADTAAAAGRVLDGRYRFFEADVLDPAGDGPMLGTSVDDAAAEAAT
jgi:hypothetical protein